MSREVVLAFVLTSGERSDHDHMYRITYDLPPLSVTDDRGKHRRNPSLQGRCADRERWCRRAVERRHASYLKPIKASALPVHGRLAEQGRHSASLLCRRACTMLLSEERLRQQGKLRWLCPSAHGHVTVKWDPTDQQLQPSRPIFQRCSAASGRGSRALQVCAAPDVGDRRSRYVMCRL